MQQSRVCVPVDIGRYSKWRKNNDKCRTQVLFLCFGRWMITNSDLNHYGQSLYNFFFSKKECEPNILCTNEWTNYLRLISIFSISEIMLKGTNHLCTRTLSTPEAQWNDEIIQIYVSFMGSCIVVWQIKKMRLLRICGWPTVPISIFVMEVFFTMFESWSLVFVMFI